MGFPVAYSELPKLLLHLLSLLGHLRRLSSWLAGLDDPAVAYSHGAAADRLEEHSPAVRFDALSPAAGDPLLPEACAVCLGDFHGTAEVRRARGCRHVFHRACLDSWAAHGHQRTCPLCRTPLLPLLTPTPMPMPPS